MRACWIVIALLVICGTAVAQLTPEEAYQKLQEKQKERAAERAAASQPAAPTTRPSGLQVGRMLHEAWDALMARHYKQAAALFDKVAAFENVTPAALEGRGICKYELKQYKLADRDLQEAYKLATRKGAAASRQLIIATAAASVSYDNPMRAVKVLRTLMESMEEDSKLDEELQNDLGIALSHANAQAKKLPYFDESLKYYTEYDKKLNEQKHNGTARWGTQWIDSGSAEQKWKTYKQAADHADQAAVIYDHAVLARVNAYDHYVELNGLRLHGTLEIKKYTEEYKQSLKDEAAAKQNLANAADRLNKVEKPPFPDRIEHDWQEPR